MKNSGFSLIEVLVAFAILSIVVITGLRILGDATRRVKQIETRTVELAAARTEMDLVESPNLVKRPIPGESVNWTEYTPVLRQIRRGDQTVLETIVIEQRKK
jgi:prepilin-type N-terminal cleavage/methylation domain-containing protein